jgi:DNA repair protein RadC
MKDIKELPGIDRPREKMITGGASLLTDAELLAILLGFGSRDTPVLTLCDRVLRSVGNSLEQLSALSLDELCAIKGIGTAKATTILAAMELGRRRLQTKIPRIKSEADAISIALPLFMGITEPHFIALLLNRQYELLATCELKLRADQPNISQLMQLVVESGAHGFGLVSNIAATAVIIEQLTAAATVLDLKFYGCVLVT